MILWKFLTALTTIVDRCLAVTVEVLLVFLFVAL